MVVRDIKGKYYIMDKSTIVSKPFNTSAEAWRALDKRNGEPHNAIEQRYEWSQKEYLRKEF